MAWLWLPAALAIIFSLLLVIPVTMQINFSYRPGESALHIQVRAWPGLKYRKTIDLLGMAQNALVREPVQPRKKTPARKKIKNWRRLSLGALHTLLFFLRQTTLHRLRWRTRIGLFDACQTALAAGLLWGIKGFFFSSLYRLSSPLRLPEMAVEPDFRRPFLAVAFESTLSARLGHILLAGIKIGYVYYTSK